VHSLQPKNKPCGELTPIAGVYLLYAGGQIYIGQAVNVLARFARHQYTRTLPNARLFLLREMEPRAGVFQEDLRNAERRFLIAAQCLNLNLVNTTLPHSQAADVDVSREIAHLNTALLLIQPATQPATGDPEIQENSDKNSDFAFTSCASCVPQTQRLAS